MGDPRISLTIPVSRGLTTRHLEAIQYMARGLTSKEIAAEMGVGLRTATKHRQAVLEHFKTNNTMCAVIAAIRQGIVKL